MSNHKKSFFERLTGTVRLDEEQISEELETEERESLFEEELPEGQLTVDMYKTETEIVIKTMVAGVKLEDLDINITRDMVSIKGKRDIDEDIEDADYFQQELYWGSFSRTITLPEEIEVEEAEAVEKHGLLTITLPKLDKAKRSKLKVKSM